MDRKPFADLIGVGYFQYTRYENNKAQPALETLWSIYKVLKSKIPDLNMQDLLEDD